MSAHTPGPWVLSVDDNSCGDDVTLRMGSALKSRGSYYVQHHITLYDTLRDDAPKTYKEAIANARLIAAAPDMLAALVNIVRAYDGPTVDAATAVSSHIKAARTAIAKAEGAK